MITNFDNFLNEEALPPSKFRKYMKQGIESGYKERYQEKFEEMKKKYDGDRNAMRIFIPLKKEDTPKSKTQEEVESFLMSIKDKRYNKNVRLQDIDYLGGFFRFYYEEGDRLPNQQRIGKFLRMYNQMSLLQRFDSDPIRHFKGEKDEFEVCISRHPYDVAGVDTDRKWQNCMTLYHYNRFTKAWLSSGMSTRFLIRDVKLGTVVSFLIKKSDRNLQEPLADITIKPFENVNDPEDTILVPDNRTYGVADENFKATVFAWCDEFNGNKIGYYKLKDGLYNDNFRRMDQDKTGEDFGEYFDDPFAKFAKRNLPENPVVPVIKRKRK